MVRKALALLVVVAVVSTVLGVIGVLGARPVEAQPTATRSFSSATVAPGGQLTVTVNTGSYGSAGSLVETLPDGFTYDGSSLPEFQVGQTGQNVTFTLFGDTEVTYTVTASSMPGEYMFGGDITDFGTPPVTATVGGDKIITVDGSDPGTGTTMPTNTPMLASFRATRSFSPASVAAGGQVVVTIEARGYGGFGQLAETLPPGFTYGSTSLGEEVVQQDGQVVAFTLFGAEDPTTFTYVVTASGAAGSHGFSGVLTNADFDEATVGGAASVTVEGDGPVLCTPPCATRSFNTDSPDPGGQVVVTIEARGYGAFGQVEETLPAGFTYESTSLGEEVVQQDGQVVAFTLFGEPDPATFTYTVTAPGIEVDYNFSGVLVTDADFTPIMVGGTTEIWVGGRPPPTMAPTSTMPVPTPTRRRSSGGGGGGGGGGYAPLPVATATPMPTRAPVATMAPTVAPPTPIIVPTVAPPTMAPPPEPTAMPDPTAVPPTPMPLPPTVMPKPTAEIPTVTPTEAPTAVPPTEMPTAVPPTEAPPTDMPTAMPPTEPPAPTATTAPTVTPVAPEEGGMPTWLIIVIIVVIVAVVLIAIGFYMMRMRR